MITIISLSDKIENFKKAIANYAEVKKAINLNECTDFRFMNNQELLIYNDRTVMYSCCHNEYKNKRYVTHIYNRKSELVYQFNIDYDA